MSSVQVSEAVDSDFSRLFEITSLAFQHNEPFWDLTYPAHDTPIGHLTSTQRFRQKTSDPIIVYTKAVNTETGQISGMARWHICNSELPPEKQYLLEGGNPGYEGQTWKKYKILSDAFMAERNAAIRAANGRIAVLDVLAVDPTFQWRGAGNELVK